MCGLVWGQAANVAVYADMYLAELPQDLQQGS